MCQLTPQAEDNYGGGQEDRENSCIQGATFKLNI
jgi:hypothetical protein